MKKFLKVLGEIVLLVFIFLLIINIIPPKKSIKGTNPFIAQDGQTMIAAHRGGKTLNPENTMLAFNAAVDEYHVDILEMDLCLTKDNQIVIIHNTYVNEYCDAEEIKGTTEKIYVEDLDLEELKTFNFGYKFTLDGVSYPYRDLNNLPDGVEASKLRIVTLEELFERFYVSNPNMLYIIEIKNDGEAGKFVADQMNTLLTTTYSEYQDNVVIGTFHDEIESYLATEHPNLYRGASEGAATKFIITQMVGVNIFDSGSFTCLQIPTSRKVKGINFQLAKKTYIKRAHRRNIAVQYWTINDKEEMMELLELGVDAIMTDNPKLLYETMVEMGLK